MEERRKGIARSKLIGMQVYNPDGSLVGTIKDVSLTIGGEKMGLLISTRYQTEIEVPWSNVGAAKDIAILKEHVAVKPPPAIPTPSPTVPAEAPVTPVVSEKEKRVRVPSILKRIVPKREKRICPTCGKSLSFIKKYGRWYCYNCKRYVD